jgi:hypothetical protein
MKKLVLFSLIAALPASMAFAAEGDLTLPGEKWIAKFDKYVCAAFGPVAARPEALERLNVQFEQLTTDSTLDNGLLLATFEENGKACRYNAIVLADNAASTIRLVDSKAYSPAGDSGCETGKAILDHSLRSIDYLYYGHPHNLALMLPDVGAGGVCNGGKVVGANFVVKGKVTPKN